MKISKVVVKNFRLLTNTTIELENELSIIIGKNNVGKTSFLKILSIFINGNGKENFRFEDFSIGLQREILELEDKLESGKEFSLPSVSLELNIKYEDSDNIGNINSLIMDLDDESNRLILLCEYIMVVDARQRILKDFHKFQEQYTEEGFSEFIKANVLVYFEKKVYAVDPTNHENKKELEPKELHNIVSMEYIGAQRDVDNNGGSQILSGLASKHYAAVKAIEDENEEFSDLHKVITDTDKKLTEKYEPIFSEIVAEIRDMSYGKKEAEIQVESQLNENQLFSNNTKVTYKHSDTVLPEEYNGLGYLNLFAIIFNIRIQVNRLRNSTAALKILFMEEPEAHTHPQMQYVFIKNIKKILAGYQNENFAFQTIMTSHSPQIVSQCDFTDIKYFRRDETFNQVKALNLSELESRMNNSDSSEKWKRAFRFVKQYITLDKAEIFFASKAILIEGDTERILMAEMMRKLDEENKSNSDWLENRLQSQDISILEVGAYSQHFKELLDFIGIKTLIITDLDSINVRNRKATYVSDPEATLTSNSSLKTFFGTSILEILKNLEDSQKMLNSNDGGKTWEVSKNGQIKIAYQTEENGYYARSFEDAFFAKNIGFVKENFSEFKGLKNRNTFEKNPNDYYEIADKCIDKKSAFALDLILLDGEGETGKRWEIPGYIKEGLEWLQK